MLPELLWPAMVWQVTARKRCSLTCEVFYLLDPLLPPHAAHPTQEAGRVSPYTSVGWTLPVGDSVLSCSGGSVLPRNLSSQGESAVSSRYASVGTMRGNVLTDVLKSLRRAIRKAQRRAHKGHLQYQFKSADSARAFVRCVKSVKIFVNCPEPPVLV